MTRDVARQPIEYEPDSGRYRVPFDSATHDTVAGVVATSVAAIEDVDQSALPAVHEFVDPEAVDRLIDSAGSGSVRASLAVRFSYGGYRVTVRPDVVLLRSTDTRDADGPVGSGSAVPSDDDL